MSDLLEVPESPLPPLEAARRRLEKALEDFESNTKHGQVARSFCDEVIKARVELLRCEQEAMRK